MREKGDRLTIRVPRSFPTLENVRFTSVTWPPTSCFGIVRYVIEGSPRRRPPLRLDWDKQIILDAPDHLADSQKEAFRISFHETIYPRLVPLAAILMRKHNLLEPLAN